MQNRFDLADRLGQIIFRIETNFACLERLRDKPKHQNAFEQQSIEIAIKACAVDIKKDLEYLKIIKSSLMAVEKPMNIQEAIEQCFKPEVYKAVKGHLSPPELLKMAVVECFLHKKDQRVEDTIRAGMIFLDATGLMPKD